MVGPCHPIQCHILFREKGFPATGTKVSSCRREELQSLWVIGPSVEFWFAVFVDGVAGPNDLCTGRIIGPEGRCVVCM